MPPTETKLLPCPFCGNKNPEIMPNGIGDFYVRCETPDEEGCSCRTDDAFCESKEHAAKRWNTRTPSPETKELEIYTWCFRNPKRWADLFETLHAGEDCASVEQFEEQCRTAIDKAIKS